MLAETMGPDIARSALQEIGSAYRRFSAFAIPNGTGETRRKGIFSTVSHPDGGFASTAREHPEANIDMPFLVGTRPLCEGACGCLPSCRKAGHICRARASRPAGLVK
jgi:hypothetical protein